MPKEREVTWMGPNDISYDEYDPRIHNKGGWWIEGEGFIADGDYAQLTIKNILNQDSEEKKEWDRRCEEASKAYAKIPQWRLDYSVEDYERDCAEEERERERKRLRFTPPPSPSPEPTASTSNAAQPQAQQPNQAATQATQPASHQSEIPAEANTDIPLSETTSLGSPVTSEMGNVPFVASQTAVTQFPISPASSKSSPSPSQQSKKRKRSSAMSTPPATRSMATRSRADQDTTFYELDVQSHSMIATTGTRKKAGGQKRIGSADKTETPSMFPSTRRITSVGQKRGSKDAKNKASSSAGVRRNHRVIASTKALDPDRLIDACWRAGIRL